MIRIPAIFFVFLQNVKTFKDVKGCDDAKQELEEVVEYLKNPTKFTRLGGKLPKVCASFWVIRYFELSSLLYVHSAPQFYLLLSCYLKKASTKVVFPSNYFGIVVFVS